MSCPKCEEKEFTLGILDYTLPIRNVKGYIYEDTLQIDLSEELCKDFILTTCINYCPFCGTKLKDTL